MKQTYDLTFPKCGMCKHPDHLIYEAKIAGGAFSMRKAGEEMGIDVATVSRHMSRCVPKRVKEIAKPEPVETVMNVINALAEQYAIVKENLERATESGKISDIALMLKEGRKHIELHARLTGQLTGPSNQINLMMNPDFVQLKQTIFNTLDPIERSKLSAKLLAAADIAEFVDDEVLE
jgi:hypothetical protein